MADSTVNLVGLDFDSIKDNLKSYLSRNDSPFKDYNFEGSNIGALLDVLAYNTYLNAFYLNMVASEMFLDTATLKDSVVSQAKELNYVPSSYTSAAADVSFVVDSGNSATGALVIPKGTTFTTVVGSNTFTFSTSETLTVSANSDGNFYVDTTIFEGAYTADAFVYTPPAASTGNKIRYVITNPRIDISSLTVSVIEDSGNTVLQYGRANSNLGLTSNSQVYFLQLAENDQYELTFGDGVLGRPPKAGASIVVDYRVSSGELPNGASTFDINGPISGLANISNITTVTPASGGSVSESIDSIKQNAPKSYQNQERAVTARDYEDILIQHFPEIQAISAYGGEEADPPVYGKVFIAVDVAGADGIPEGTKRRFYDYIKPKSPVSIDPVFISPEFMYVDVKALVRYNINNTSLKTSDIRTLVTSSISQYNLDSLNNFKKTLRYSRLINLIDNAHPSIISNDTTITPYKTYLPTLGVKNTATIKFGFEIDSTRNLSSSHLQEETHGITSSRFVFGNRNCVLEDDGNGNINVSALIGDTHSVIETVGTIDYATGTITLSNFEVTSYSGDSIRIYAIPAERDITSSKNVVLSIRDADIVVDVLEVRE